MDHRRLFQHHLSDAKAHFEAALRHMSTRDRQSFTASLDAMLFACARARRIARERQWVTASSQLAAATRRAAITSRKVAMFTGT